MSSLYTLLFHTGYDSIEIGLARNGVLLASHTLAKHQASKELLLGCTALLDRCQLTLSDCSFFSVHRGPAPFTTLRVTLATVNGLAYASGKPLVGVDGLDAFIEEVRHTIKTPYIAVLLNAFCDDLYFALYDVKKGMLVRGCDSVERVHTRIVDLLSLHSTVGECLITLVGNGVALHRDLWNNSFLPQNIIIPDPLPLLASIASINDIAWKLWSTGQTIDQVLPLYLKASTAALCPTLDDALCSL